MPTAESALAEADFSDRLRKGGVRRSPVDGLPIGIKDCYDAVGFATEVNSALFAGASGTGKTMAAEVLAGEAPVVRVAEDGIRPDAADDVAVRQSHSRA
jgi:aspartyl-tRNA(Asn)/glutamyl-tRNA(Gln) amidotransferase subunit A